MKPNRLYTKVFPLADLKKIFAELLDFFKEAFEEFDGVNFIQGDTTLGIYFGLPHKASISIQPAEPDDTGLLIEYYLRDEKCSLVDKFSGSSSGNVYIGFFKTRFGLMWSVSNSLIDENFTASLNRIYVAQATPALVLTSSDATSADIFFLTTQHEKIEKFKDNANFLENSLGGQRFAATSAYCFDENVEFPHLYRVLGIPNSTYSKGKIQIGEKTMVWTGRYALEYDPQDDEV